MENQKPKGNAMEKLASFIVDKRNLFFLLYIFALIFCAVATGWVKVENDITTYLPDSTETRQGLTVMNDNFITYGSARVMVSNISYDTALDLQEIIEDIDGVDTVEFDATKDHYADASALYSVSFDAEADDDRAKTAMQDIRDALADYDTYVDTQVGVDTSADLQAEMSVIIVIAAIIIVVVLTLTSRSYAEVPVLILTFGTAALLNMGTNFLCGTISFISNSVTVILQLALAIDYAIILCHRFSDEHETLDTREACIAALSKAIPEISSSSLTTISGLAALGFMHFGIGRDLAVVLIKAILFSMLAVFTLMPGLLVLFSRLIDKTRHKNLIPKITAVGKFDVKTRYIVPPIFAVIVIAAAVFANKCPYCYTFTDLVTAKQSESQIAYQKIKNEFGTSNMVAVIVPSGNYENEGKILAELENCPEVKSTMGLANIEAMDGYMLTDAVTPRQLAEMAGLDYEVAKALYGAYAIDHDQYGEFVNGLGNYKVPIYDMFRFLEQEMHDGNVTLSGDVQDTLDDLFAQLDKAQVQLQAENYSRMVAYLSVPEESSETFAFLDKMHDMVSKYYPEDAYIVGNTTSAMDLSSSFGEDNLLISVLSALFVILVLLFTFKSAGLPVLLIFVIQGSIWINFSVPYLQDSPLYFLGYLIVNSIQMGANIDYAIVISSHYTDLKKVMHHKDAIVTALNESFPTIFTSGSILASAGVLISVLTTNPVIAAIGECLGRGTIVSILLVLFVLPQILVLGDVIIERTSFEMKGIAGATRNVSGTMHINGRVRGYINGVVDADIKGVLHGQFNAAISTGTEVDVTQPDMYLTEGSVAEAEAAETNDTTEGGGEQ
ncbi:efflux RND transporter permease subunit [Gemmiger sp.]|uniref:efflux RND transporter permease subunit n=1 Tax=Gemmiger sp. TaxID=2049027 RepID=UPI002A74A675|nr:MMPL family transporter [Gemmiger sp.]MDY2694088.1 MMPL family transporter [Gemmiger sp.]